MSDINDTEEIHKGNFSINLKLISQYQWMEPIPMDKNEDEMYHKGYFCGGSNIDLSLITCEDKIVIPPIIQK